MIKFIPSKYTTIDLEPKDLEYTLSTIYGKRAAKMYVKRGFKLSLQSPEYIEEEEEEELATKTKR
jgi:hypothetical protein